MIQQVLVSFVVLKGIKGMLALVCSKVDLTLLPRHTWWLDYGATTHISVYAGLPELSKVK